MAIQIYIPNTATTAIAQKSWNIYILWAFRVQNLFEKAYPA